MGVTEMDLSTGAWQFTKVDPDPPPVLAVIVAALLAPARHVTSPPETVTTLELELQIAVLVTFCGGPKEKLAVAVNCTVLPAGTV